MLYYIIVSSHEHAYKICMLQPDSGVTQLFPVSGTLWQSATLSGIFRRVTLQVLLKSAVV